jgi:TolB protein
MASLPRWLQSRWTWLMLLVAAVILALIWFLLRRPQPPVPPPVPATPTATPTFLPTPTATPSVTSTPTLTPTATPTPTPVGGGGLIVFDWLRDGNRDLYLVNLAGGEPVRLTSHLAEDRSPAWSPDGTRVAFESHRDGNWELYVLDLRTGGLRRLTDEPHYDGAPAWSPDGTRIAFESQRTGDLDVFVLDLRDGSLIQLTNDPTPEYGPVWSPDGRHVAFVAWRDALPTGEQVDWNREIFVVPADGDAEPINLTRDPHDDYDPAWSPDPRRLAFVSDRAGTPGLYTLELPARVAGLASAPPPDDAVVQVVPAGGGLLSQPTWSPDGQALAYVVELRNRWYVTARGLAPGAPTAQPVQVSEVIGHPAWRAGPAPNLARLPEPSGIGLTPTPLFVERVDPTPETGPPYRTKTLPGVTGGIPRLSDRVDDSFMALRARVKAETGRDLLAALSDGFRPIGFNSDGSSYQSWHKAGRAVDLNIDEYDAEGRLVMVIVREDRQGRTWWRLYLRAAVQDGSQGEPLKMAPWELWARFIDREAQQAGGQRRAVPAGYWIDFTALAEQYGWRRIAANDRPGLSWRDDWKAIEYWHFENRGDLNWWQAMRELYDQATLDKYF